MNAARFKAIAKDLVPPLLVRWFRTRGPQSSHEAPAATVHQVESGPLKGVRLLMDTSRPAFQDMRTGSYDAFMWPALPAAPMEGIVLDIGAHIGYSTLGLAAMYVGATVVAFEPNPVNLERISANLGLNPALAARIGVEGLALADTHGELAFSASGNVDDETSSGGYLAGVTPPLDQQIYRRAGFKNSTVPVRRLDDLDQERGWARISLMKIDVEGAEHLVLMGARGVLSRDRPFLCIEVHSVACMHAVDEILRPLGYTVEILHAHRPSRAHIIAY